MSNPTNTNQASEDELDNILDNIFWLGYKFAIDKLDKTPNEYLAETIEAIAAIIRTEKLKLLAEVRGRVVGDNEDTQKWEDPIDRQVADECNQLRAEMRTILTKLEAEL